MTKALPFTKEQVETLVSPRQGGAGEHPTPFYIYDEAGIRRQARALVDAFSWNRGFKQHFAVKALPNPSVLSIMREEGCGADCSSLPELILADRAGIKGEEIMFSSNDTPAEEFVEAKKRGAIINLDDVGHLDFLENCAGLPELICFRYTPLSLKSGNDIIGNPKESKFGLTREQLFDGYRRAKEKGVRRFGLHTMPVSNELRVAYHLEAVRELFTVAKEIQENVGISFEFINLGGGIGIPYHPSEKPLAVQAFGKHVSNVFTKFCRSYCKNLELWLEPGRYLVAEAGALLVQVTDIKRTTAHVFVGVDSGFNHLIRPVMYGAYHHVFDLSRPLAKKHIVTVVGNVCETDTFAEQREMPLPQVGDLLLIADAGAYGYSMSSNYHLRKKPKEVVLP